MMKYLDMVKINNSFWDTIDFKQFMIDEEHINVRDLMNCIEDYFDEGHPDLLPPEFQGCFFNFMGEDEFAHYLGKRYGYDVRSETVEKWYVFK